MKPHPNTQERPLSVSSDRVTGPDPAGADAPVPGEPAARASRTLFASLKLPVYRRYLFSFAASGFGFQNQVAVQGWLAFDLTGEALNLGGVLAATGIAQTLGGFGGGVLADRFDRKRTIMVAQVVMMTASLAVALLLFADLIHLWHLYAIAVLIGAGMSIHMPARQAFLHDIVGRSHIADALALNAGVNNSMRLVAPALAGVVITFTSIGFAYMMTVGAYFASLALLAVVVGAPATMRVATAVGSPLRDFGDGMRHLWKDRTLFWLVFLALGASVLGLPFRNMMPAFARDALGQDAAGWGLLLSMAGLGSVFGSVAVAAVAGSSSKGKLVLATGVMWGGAFSLMALAPNMGSAIPALLLLGAVSTSFNTLTNIVIQTNVEDAYRGRILSFYMMTFSVNHVGSLGIGVLIDLFGVREALFGTGLALVAFAGVISLVRRDLRRVA